MSVLGQLEARIQPHPLVSVVALFFVLEQFAALLAVLSFEHLLCLAEEREPAQRQRALVSGPGLFSELFEQFGLTTTEQFIVQGEKELVAARVTLASGSTDELTIDPCLELTES